MRLLQGRKKNQTGSEESWSHTRPTGTQECSWNKRINIDIQLLHKICSELPEDSGTSHRSDTEILVCKIQMDFTVQVSVDVLKENLTVVRFLAYPDTNKPCVLYTDASNICIGSCLTQKTDDEHEKPIYFLSHRPKSNKIVNNRKERFCHSLRLTEIGPLLTQREVCHHDGSQASILDTVNVVIFAGGKFRENVGKTFHVGVIFTKLLLFPS